MKAPHVRVKTFDAGSAAALDTAIQSFLDGLGEAEYLDLRFAVAQSSHASDDADVPLFAAQLTYVN